ncbi:MAG TPA: SRPBCC domain-containing protein, partial [Rhizomicrobium sp.]|nr:SRPBCC domain-containing protein [Rhizomicrobium sp.]
MNKTDLARFIDRWTIEYVRVYPHPVERVWRAVTDAAEIQAWFFGPASIDQRIGGAYALGGPDTVFKGTVTALQPPRLVRYAGPEPHGPQGYWQFELEEVA